MDVAAQQPGSALNVPTCDRERRSILHLCVAKPQARMLKLCWYIMGAVWEHCTHYCLQEQPSFIHGCGRQKGKGSVIRGQMYCQHRACFVARAGYLRRSEKPDFLTFAAKKQLESSAECLMQIRLKWSRAAVRRCDAASGGLS